MLAFDYLTQGKWKNAWYQLKYPYPLQGKEVLSWTGIPRGTGGEGVNFKPKILFVTTTSTITLKGCSENHLSEMFTYT